MVRGLLFTAAGLEGLLGGDLDGIWLLELSSILADTGTAAFCAGVWPTLVGSEGTALGDVVALLLGPGAGWIADTFGFDADAETGAGVTFCGGGKGAIPIALLSLAAAAAAAEAYFNVSPGARVGKGAGFMALLVILLEVLAKGVCNVARAGNGDFN